MQKSTETHGHLCALDGSKPALAAMFHKVTEEALEFRTADQNPRFPADCDTIADLLPTDSP